MSRRSDDHEVNRKGGLAYAAAFALFASVAVLTGLGWLVDRWLGTGPWCLGLGLVLGAILGFVEFFRLSARTY